MSCFASWKDTVLRPQHEALADIAVRRIRPHAAPVHKASATEYELCMKEMTDRGLLKIVGTDEALGKYVILVVQKKGDKRFVPGTGTRFESMSDLRVE